VGLAVEEEVMTDRLTPEEREAIDRSVAAVGGYQKSSRKGARTKAHLREKALLAIIDRLRVMEKEATG
jgi:hypothetical protein